MTGNAYGDHENMPLMRSLPWLMTAIMASAATIVSGAREEFVFLLLSGAFSFATALVAVSSYANEVYITRTDDAGGVKDRPAAAGNAALIAIGYFWGGFCMFSVYALSGLYWRHGWQYGLGMLLIAVLLSTYAWLLHSRVQIVSRPAALQLANWLAMAHALAAATGLSFLIGSGKILSTKPDWPANQIFLAGGLMMVTLSGIAVATHWRIDRTTSAERARSQAELASRETARAGS